MKNFIKKLIEKFEKEAFAAQLDKGIKHPSTLDAMMEKFTVFRIKEIVNQVVEEYKDKEVLDMAQVSADYAKARLEELKRISNNGWIPCSEKLPDKDMWCWATFESGSVDKIYYFASQKWWNGEISDNRVVAWMPLPEPYKTEF